MNVDEIALRVADRLEPRGRTYSPDHYIEFAHALLAELSKDAEPSCIVSDTGIIQNVTDRPLEPRLKLFTCPDNTAEIEQRVAEACKKASFRAKVAELEAESLKWKEACRKEYLSAIDWAGKTQAAEIDLAAEQHKVKVLTEALAHIRLLASFESGRNDAEIHETARKALSTVRGRK